MGQAPLLLALDPGRDVGVCLGTPDAAPEFSTWKLPMDPDSPHDIGAAMDSFALHLEDVLRRRKPRLVLMEAPHVRPVGTDIKALRLLFGLCGHVELACRRARIPVRETSVAEARAAVRIEGQDRRMQKADVRAAVRLRGLNARNQHEADAAALWFERVVREDILAGAGGAWADRFRPQRQPTVGSAAAGCQAGAS
jgi:hypothetical protein